MNWPWFYQLQEFVTIIHKPIWDLYTSQQVSPIIGVLLLGLLSAFAPSQYSINLGFISYTINQMTQGEKWFQEIMSVFVGKTLTYFILMLLIIWTGREWSPSLEVINKLIGPLFLVTGLYFISWIMFSKIFKEKVLKYTRVLDKLSRKKRGFLLGILFALVFCPSKVLFFSILLTPLVLSADRYGFALPLVFSFGMFIPILLFIGVAFGFGVDRMLAKHTKRIWKLTHVGTGVLFSLIGISNMILYWG